MIFEGVFSRSGPRAEARRERKAAREVRIQSDAAAEYIAVSSQDSIRFNIGQPPEGLTGETFMDRVGNRTVSLLSEHSVRDIVTYDREASQRSTEEIEAIGAGASLPRGTEGVRVIFNRIAEAS